MSEENIRRVQDIMENFRRLNRFSDQPTWKPETVDQWANQLRVRLPESYRRVVTTGSYDKGNFGFVPLELTGSHNNLLIFGAWNDDRFAFDLSRQRGDGEAPILVLLPDLDPEERFADFPGWFENVLKTSSEAVNPE